MRRALAATCFALAFLASACFAQSTAPTPQPPPSSAPGEASIHGYGDRDKTCLTWTDQCRSCQRAADDQIHCNNIGIACQPAAIACTERKAEPKGEPKTETKTAPAK